MNELLTLTLAWLSGIMLGIFFFGGLWWTIRKAVASKQPALWFMGSLLLRMAVILTGFYIFARNGWQKLLLSLLGFVMARLLVSWLTRPLPLQPANPSLEAAHAPHA